MERITITKTLKCMFCGVPPLDLNRIVDIKHRSVLIWISYSSPFHGKNRSVFRTYMYVAENEIVYWCYLTPSIFICSVAYRYVYLNPYREGYTNIYISSYWHHTFSRLYRCIVWAMIEELSIRRQSAHFWSVGGRKRVLNIMLIYRHDIRPGLQ